MAIVLDSNQVGLFCKQLQKDPRSRPFDIVLPPNVLAELILWGKQPSLSQLFDLKPKIGLHLGDVMSVLAKSNEDEIQAFTPFPSSETVNLDLYDQLLDALRGPSTKQKQWATDWKEKNKIFCKHMKKKALVFRKILNDKKSRGHFQDNYKLGSIKEAFEAFGKGTQSFLGSLVTSIVAGSGDQHQLAIADFEKFYDAVMSNPFVSGLFRTVLFYILSYSRLWDHAHQYLNFDPAADRDDWVDMTLPLYAKRGDIIMTDDKKLINAIATVYIDIMVKKVADL